MLMSGHLRDPIRIPNRTWIIQSQQAAHAPSVSLIFELELELERAPACAFGTGYGGMQYQHVGATCSLRKWCIVLQIICGLKIRILS